MDAQGFVAALAPAVTDANAPERFLADTRAVLVAAGLDLPEWFTVSAREREIVEGPRRSGRTTRTCPRLPNARPIGRYAIRVRQR